MKYSWLVIAGLMFVFTGHADEGLWLFNQPPREILRERYQFEPSDAWLEHLQKSSVRIGASASFVSADGLLISNHHVGAGPLERLSTPEKNYLHDGFYARTPAEELKIPDVELNVLESIEDVAVIPPDLVLACSDLQADVVSDLVRAGVPVLCTNQRSIDDIFRAIRLVGVSPLPISALSADSKSVRPARKPGVLMLAMLSAVTR